MCWQSLQTNADNDSSKISALKKECTWRRFWLSESPFGKVSLINGQYNSQIGFQVHFVIRPHLSMLSYVPLDNFSGNSKNSIKMWQHEMSSTNLVVLTLPSVGSLLTICWDSSCSWPRQNFVNAPLESKCTILKWCPRPLLPRLPPPSTYVAHLERVNVFALISTCFFRPIHATSALHCAVSMLMHSESTFVHEHGDCSPKTDKLTFSTQGQNAEKVRIWSTKGRFSVGTRPSYF